MMHRQVIFSGATSALAQRCMQELLAQGVEVFALVRRNSERISQLQPHEPNLNAKLHIIELNLQELADNVALELLEQQGCSNPSVFYHFGWVGVQTKFADNIQLQSSNIQYTLDAINLLAKLNKQQHTIPPRFVYAGSQAELARGVKKEQPQDAYGIAKLAAAKLGMILADQQGIDFIHARIYSTYGVGNRTSSLLHYIIPKFLKGEDVTLSPCGQTWDWLEFKDAAALFYLLGFSKAVCSSKIDNQIQYECGSGIGKLLSKWVIEILDIVNENKKQLWKTPLKRSKVTFGVHPYHPAQCGLDFVANTSTLQQLGWQGPSVCFEDGIAPVIQEVYAQFLVS